MLWMALPRDLNRVLYNATRTAQDPTLIVPTRLRSHAPGARGGLARLWRFGGRHVLMAVGAVAFVALGKHRHGISQQATAQLPDRLSLLRRGSDQAISHFLCGRARRVGERSPAASPAVVWAEYHEQRPDDLATMVAIASRCLEVDDLAALESCLMPYARFEARLESAHMLEDLAEQGIANEALAVELPQRSMAL